MSNLSGCIDPYGFLRTNCDGNLYDEPAPYIPPFDINEVIRLYVGRDDLLEPKIEINLVNVESRTDDELSLYLYDRPTVESFLSVQETSNSIPEPSLLCLLPIALIARKIWR